MLTIYGLLLLGIHIKTCMSSNWAACPAWSPPVTLLFMISFGLEGLSFLSFTGIMTCTQLYSIYTDTTQIELFKGVTYLNRERNSFIYSLKIVFGSRMGLTWLNPFSKPIDLITQDDERIIFDI
ncbi:unnamed protein product [Rotaria sp. Silwood1]|nr:unnamed protein product [Rotaria sp. Silwood1]